MAQNPQNEVIKQNIIDNNYLEEMKKLAKTDKIIKLN